MRDNKLRDWVTIGIAALALVFSLLVEYTHTDKENAKDIAALKAQRIDDDKRLDGIQQDIRDVKGDVSKLVEWAMGKK